MRGLRWSALLLAVVTVSMSGAAYARVAGRSCTVDCVATYVPTGSGRPFAIVRAQGGEWFADSRSIQRIDASGNIVRYHVQGTKGTDISWLTRASDGSMWFVERNSDRVGRMSPHGHITQYDVPAGSGPQGIVAVPGGDVYFTEPGLDAIGRLDPATGDVTEFDSPTSPGNPLDVVLGPDGALWFTEENSSRVGRMTLGGMFTEYDLAPGSFPLRIVVGPDGALWFTELRVGSVGRITTDGVLTQYAIGSSPVGITRGRDGMLYVALFSGRLVQVDANGEVTGSWDLPGSAFQVGRGSGREIWVTDYYGRHVYRVTPYAKI